MTSRNSFWVSSIENHKRRIWVWIVAALGNLMAYVGVLSVYLSRIRTRNADGVYKTGEEFRDAMYQATKDALGFQTHLGTVLVILAVIIGVQGFSYLYDRKKVDMYHSVPVNKNKRFVIIYVNGLIIYLVTALTSILIAVIAAASQGAVNGEVLAVTGVGFVWNLLFFLVVYHTAVLAVMLTGNCLITLAAVAVLMLYEVIVYTLAGNMKYSFFKTVSGFYVTQSPKLSVFSDYSEKSWRLKQLTDVNAMVRGVLPYYGKWFILALVILAAAWLCYRKRPSEAAGRALAFTRIEPFLKIIIVVPAGLWIGMLVRDETYGNTMLTVAGMAVSGVIACAVMEIIFDFDLRSLHKHLISSGVAIAGIIMVFLVFEYDLTGYDKYLPSADELDSVAVSVDYYGSFWDEDFTYVSSADFSREHMFLKDVEPVLSLAEVAQQKDSEDMDDARNVNVLYRLKSGRQVGRCFYVDFSDPASGEQMNSIIRTKEFKDGTYQIMTDQASYDKAAKITYSNGAVNVVLPASDAQKLRDAYLKDMEQYDFTLAAEERPCGQITFSFPNWMEDSLNVYSCFENTITYLQSQEAYYPIQLNAEDIADITVTNYHHELEENDGIMPAGEAEGVETGSDFPVDNTVTKTFLAQEEIEQIVGVIYPEFMSSGWNDDRELDRNYDIYITFKKDTAYPYDRSNYGVYYKFYTDKVPEFVKEATAPGAGD